MTPPEPIPDDRYRLASRWYDLFIDPLVHRVKRVALDACPVSDGMAVLDVGCGTGTLLERIGRSGCGLWGIDASPAMLGHARRRLGPRAELHQGSAERLPFPDGRFDVVSFTMVLHELTDTVRGAAVREASRVVRPGGRLLVVDYAAEAARSLLGRASRAAAIAIEWSAGGEHWAGYRSFVVRGGVDGLLEQHGLVPEVRRVVAAGTFVVSVSRP